MLTFFDGFENYSNLADIQWNWISNSSNSAPSILPTGGVSNSRAISLTGPNNQSTTANDWWLNKNVEFSKTISTGMAIRYSTVSPSNNNINPIFQLMYDNNTNICVYLKYVIGGGFIPIFTKILSNNSNDFIAVGNLLQTGFKLSDWHYYELELDCSTTGFARFYVDGNMVLELSNYDFSAGSIQLTNRFRTYAGIWQGVSVSISTTTAFDDFYITNTDTRLGQIRIQAIRPSADTAQKDWIPSTGSTNYNIVNKIGLSSGTYVSTNIQDAIDLYEVGDLTDSTGISNIIGIKASSYSDKNMFGEANYNIILNSNLDTINFPKADLFEQRIALNETIMENNPIIDAPWTVGDINNLQIGISRHDEINILGTMISGNIVNGISGSQLMVGDTPPIKNGNILTFNGSQVIRYTDAPNLHVVAPWSIEFECYFNQLNTMSDSMTIFNIGKDGSTHASELTISLSSANSLYFQTANSDNIGAETLTYLINSPSVQAETWYRIGLMVYDDGDLRIRSYVNGVIITDDILLQPYDSTAGWSIGNDISKSISSAFKGRIRNLKFGKSLFWKI